MSYLEVIRHEREIEGVLLQITWPAALYFSSGKAHATIVTYSEAEFRHAVSEGLKYSREGYVRIEPDYASRETAV